MHLFYKLLPGRAINDKSLLNFISKNGSWKCSAIFFIIIIIILLFKFATIMFLVKDSVQRILFGLLNLNNNYKMGSQTFKTCMLCVARPIDEMLCSIRYG